MSNGSQAICAAVGAPAGENIRALRDNSGMPDDSPDLRRSRLRKHADYQLVYKASRKHFSPSMSYFFRRRAEASSTTGVLVPRVGLTAGKVLGKAVERNRIKRRMREAVRMNLAQLPPSVDVVLHPRKSVIAMEFRQLSAEVARVFSSVSSQAQSSHVDKRTTKQPGTNNAPTNSNGEPR
jgi:ribonuclease P protein component